MTAAVATAATLGLVIPTLFHVVERDPRIASGPITLALTDLGAMFYYLGLAYLLV
jgi:magnesium transporter